MTVHYLPKGIAIQGSVAASVKSLLPGAGWVMFQNEPTAVVPHTLETARLLRNLGVEVDSPMLNDPSWGWSGRFQPYEHQKVTAGFLTLHDRAFVFNDMGTGKTASAIWAAEYLRAQGKARSVLIASPLSTLRSVWLEELFNVAPGARVEVLHGGKNLRKMRLATPAEYYVVNHHGLKLLLDDLHKHPHITHIIVDEASAFKNHKSDMFTALRQIAKNRSLWLMTGSPMAQSPLDAYGIAKLVCPDRIPSTHARFRDLVMEQISHYRWVPKRGATEAVFAALQPAVRFAKADCLDLPPVTHVPVQVDLTPEQTRLLTQLNQESLADLSSGVAITAANAAVALGKRLQVAQGSIKDETGRVHDIDASPRIERVKELVAEAPAKWLVFAPFTASIDKLSRELASPHYNVGVIDGRVPLSERAKLIRDFQDPTNLLRGLVLHPKTAAHGLTLTEASVTIWYGPILSAELYDQANARTDRPGQTRNVTIYNVAATSFERDWFRALKAKQVNQQTLLDMYRRTVHEV